MPEKLKSHSSAIVRSIKPSGHQRILRLATDVDGTVQLHRFALVGKNDELHFSGLNHRKMWLEGAEDRNQQIPLLPSYGATRKVLIGAKEFRLRFSEVDNPEKLHAYESLERFHYRSSPSLIEQDDLTDKGGSRKAVLMASLEIGNRTEHVGYIELGMPLMMVAPRHRAFARPFKHTKRDIAWATWNQHSLRQNLNLIVRIARVVTHPTFRGIGLARELVSVAEDFAKKRWHIKRRSPIFIEISAEMLNYFDFVSGSGYVYCGHTEGNVRRLAKDMKAMSKGQKITSGIMTLQKKYFDNLRAFAEQQNLSVDEAIRVVGKIAENDDPLSAIPSESYMILRKLFRMPRPYFLKGLDADAKRYLRDVAVENPNKREHAPRKHSASIKIEGLKVTAEIDLPLSKNVKAITNAFGLEGRRIRQVLLDIPNFSANSGNVYLFTGASGTGKSIFLDVLASRDHPLPPNIEMTYEECVLPESLVFPEMDPNSVVIDHFANKYGMRVGLETLAKVGLSEAVPLVKPYWMLSKGQKYRVRLADLICRNKPLWVLDEFGSDLDPITASVVASQLRKIVGKLGVIAFVAAANNRHFLKALRPTSVLRFDIGVSPRILKASEYEDEFF